MIEFRNTPERSTVEKRDSSELLEDLCIALREVAIREDFLPKSEVARAAVQEAVLIAKELDARGMNATERIDLLSQETGWRMGHQPSRARRKRRSWSNRNMSFDRRPATRMAIR